MYFDGSYWFGFIVGVIAGKIGDYLHVFLRKRDIKKMNTSPDVTQVKESIRAAGILIELTQEKELLWDKGIGIDTYTATYKGMLLRIGLCKCQKSAYLLQNKNGVWERFVDNDIINDLYAAAMPQKGIPVDWVTDYSDYSLGS